MKQRNKTATQKRIPRFLFVYGIPSEPLLGDTFILHTPPPQMLIAIQPLRTEEAFEKQPVLSKVYKSPMALSPVRFAIESIFNQRDKDKVFDGLPNNFEKILDDSNEWFRVQLGRERDEEQTPFFPPWVSEEIWLTYIKLHPNRTKRRLKRTILINKRIQNSDQTS